MQENWKADISGPKGVASHYQAWRLSKRPVGKLRPENYTLTIGIFSQELGEDEVQVAGRYYSVDPYMRIQQSVRDTWDPPQALDSVQPGGVVGVVEAVGPRVRGVRPGDWVQHYGSWQTRHRVLASDVKLFSPGQHPWERLGALGMPGRTAWVGMLEHGAPTPGDKVLVTAAAGAVGHLAAQLASLSGAEVMALAGPNKKVERIRSELGLGALSYREPDWTQQLQAWAPDGIDVFFDNVGGDTSERVIPLMADHGRIVVCGQVSQYQGGLDTPPQAPRWLHHVLYKRLRLQGFLARDSAHRHNAIASKIEGMLESGALRSWVSMVEGFASLPQALVEQLAGKHQGKVIVRVSEHE